MYNLYSVEIKEVSTQIVTIEARNAEEAQRLVEESYWANPNAYVLEPEDTTFEVL